MKSTLKPLCLVALLWASGPPGNATRFVPLSIEEIRDKADVIVQGVVQSKTCARDADGRIFTRIEMAVTETWKAPTTLSTNVSIVQSGGILGEEGAMVAGQANYEIGEEVVAFLVANPRGELVTFGLAHGKFHVSKHPKTGEKFAQNIFHGARTPENASLSGSTPRALSLSELKRRVLERKP